MNHITYILKGRLLQLPKLLQGSLSSKAIYLIAISQLTAFMVIPMLSKFCYQGKLYLSLCKRNSWIGTIFLSALFLIHKQFHCLERGFLNDSSQEKETTWRQLFIYTYYFIHTHTHTHTLPISSTLKCFRKNTHLSCNLGGFIRQLARRIWDKQAPFCKCHIQVKHTTFRTYSSCLSENKSKSALFHTCRCQKLFKTMLRSEKRTHRCVLCPLLKATWRLAWNLIPLPTRSCGHYRCPQLPEGTLQ